MDRGAVRTSGCKPLLLATSCLVLSAASAPALAQQAAASPGPVQSAGGGAQQVEQIVVSGSRVVTSGINAPTPVTVASTEQLQLAAPRNLVDAVLELPQFRASVSVANQANGTTLSNGSDYLNLRGLGTSRTLVLLDGRRMTPNQNTSAVDAAQIPEALIQRVDIVTGGASAAYGSDAVAGVANFILDTKFTGLKINLQGGISSYGDNGNYKGDITFGKSFLNNRLHVVGSFLHYHSDGVPAYADRDWTSRGRVAITNPAVTAANPASPTNPKLIVVDNGNSTVAANGGLITNTLLKGTTFDPSGQPRPFRYGSLVSATQMNGSDPGTFNPNLLLVLQARQTRDQFYTHTTYDLNDNLSFFAQVIGSTNKIYYHSIPTFELSSTAYTIFADNAYLPAAVRNTMAANNIPSFTLGRLSDDIAVPAVDGVTRTGMVTVGFDGKVAGTSWSYHGYGQIGRSSAQYLTMDDPISDNLYRAADAVVNPANGQIVCRSTLANPGDGCVPMNLFGYHAPSAQSIGYVLGTAVQRYFYHQNVAEFSASGELFNLPAGPVSAAFGASYRRESLKQTADPISQRIRTGAGIRGYPAGLINSLGGFERTNPQPAAGAYDVKELFGEAEVPLLKDLPLFYSLTANGAVRYVDYSTSGGVTPWKIGGVWRPTDWVRFRATRSTDIRAPNLGDLYKGSSQGTANVNDPFANNAAVTVLTGSVGNTGLKPEIAKGTTLGVVLTPEQVLPRFSLSVDYYSINMTDAISTLSAQQELTNCFQGATDQCAFIVRGTNGALARILQPGFNAAFAKTRGVDIEASYSLPLSSLRSSWNGRLSMRAIVNYLDDLETAVVGAPAVNAAGDISQSEPKWMGTFQATLDLGRGRVFVQERFIGSGQYQNTDPAGGPVTVSTININHAPSVAYTDLTLTYDLSRQLNAFVSISNLFNKDPPMIPGFLTAASSFGNSPVGGIKGLYDFIGRTFTLGVHYKM